MVKFRSSNICQIILTFTIDIQDLPNYMAYFQNEKFMSQEPWTTVFERLHSRGFRPYMVHNIVQYRNPGYNANLVTMFNSKDEQCKQFTNTKLQQCFYLIAKHPIPDFNHLHNLHECIWNSRKCPCSKFSWYVMSEATTPGSLLELAPPDTGNTVSTIYVSD